MTIEACNTLEDVRSHIDEIDRALIALIAERSEYVKQAARFKKDVDAVKAPARVEKVIEKVRAESGRHGLDPDVTEAVYRTMIDQFVRMELKVHQGGEQS